MYETSLGSTLRYHKNDSEGVVHSVQRVAVNPKSTPLAPPAADISQHMLSFFAEVCSLARMSS